MYINYESRVLKRGGIYYVGREGEGQPAVVVTNDEVLSQSPAYISVVYISGSEAKYRCDSPFYVKIFKTGRPAVIECDNQHQIESLCIREHIASLDEEEISRMNEAMIRYQDLRPKNDEEVLKLQCELKSLKTFNDRLLNILGAEKEIKNATDQQQTKTKRRRASVSKSTSGV